MKDIGIYIHVPFCAAKCPYCDFYSHPPLGGEADRYTSALCGSIRDFSSPEKLRADTVYFGGGTPGLIGAHRIGRIISSVRERFAEAPGCEITAELNPSAEDLDFSMLRFAGVNRISVGLQSADDGELALLGRRHSSKGARQFVQRAKQAGFENISLDLMIALPGQTKEKLKRSVQFCIESGAVHISAYILKIEPGTVFYHKRDSLVLPDDDETAELYEYLCSLMRENGFGHYEISNFCLPGYESRHNLKYWHDEEYLGFGPSAHSFYRGKRYYSPRNMQDFYDGRIVPDGDGGSSEEFIMLALRLAGGLTEKRYAERFGTAIPQSIRRRAEKFTAAGLADVSENGIALTEKGFMVSNALIAEILG